MNDADSGDLLLIAAGDIEPMSRLIDRWKRVVYTVFEKCMDSASATEAVTEVFFRLYRTAAKYEPGTPFPIWLHSIAAKLIQERSPVVFTPIPPARLRESASARKATLRSAVLALPGRERAAFLLTRAARLSVADTARVLGTGDDEVKRLLVRAMEMLSVNLADLAAEPELVSLSTMTRGSVEGTRP